MKVKTCPFLSRFDIAAVQSSIEAEVPAAVGERLARAEANVLRDIGEWDAAWNLEKPYAIAAAEKLRSPRSEVQGEGGD
jgi:hypothetical protein